MANEEKEKLLVEQRKQASCSMGSVPCFNIILHDYVQIKQRKSPPPTAPMKE